MSDDPIIDDTRRKLSDLEQQIRAAKSSLGPHKEIAAEAHKDWEDMVSTHADLARKLEGDQSAAVVEGVSLDIDVLRHSFERWMARVEGNYARDAGDKGGR